MKFKYFLRGLGVGIIFAAIVFLTAYNGKPSKELSDAEIIERAKNLEMVEAEDPIKELLTTEKDKKKEEKKEKKDKTTEKKKTEATTEEVTTMATTTEEITTTEATTEKVTTEATTETKTEAAEGENVTVTVARGDNSYTVSKKLFEAGLIKDAAEFDTYLVENGYANRIRIDTYSFKIGMDFHEIAEIITKTP